MRKIIYVFIILTFSFLGASNVKADYKAAALNNSGATCNLYKGSTGYCFYKDSNLNSYNALIWLDTGDEVTVLTSYPKIESKNKALFVIDIAKNTIIAIKSEVNKYPHI